MTLNTKEKEKEEEISNFICATTQIKLEKGSTCEHTHFQDLSSMSRGVEVISAVGSADSRYSLSVLQMGGLQHRLNVHVNLSEPNANCSVSERYVFLIFFFFFFFFQIPFVY
jgi:hypothetical protein